jgi:hypothetical protein
VIGAVHSLAPGGEAVEHLVGRLAPGEGLGSPFQFAIQVRISPALAPTVRAPFDLVVSSTSHRPTRFIQEH